MRKLLLLSILGCMMSIASYGQQVSAKQGISFKALFMDYQSQNGGSFGAIKDYDYGYEIGYYRQLQDNLKLVVPFKVGSVTSHTDSEVNGSPIYKKVYGLDAQIQYQFLKDSSVVTPYVVAGLGGVSESEGEFNMQAPLGLGFQFKASDRAFINVQTEYRVSFSDDRNNIQHAIGFVYWFGPDTPKKEEMPEIEEEEVVMDSDMDGILDDVDLCPNAFGAKELNGCPDGDGDGVADYLDNCPTQAGLSSFKGCPDTDGDGLSDNKDECPNIYGSIENKGCPSVDRDNDGILDADDNCPDIAGPADNGGCPRNDKDSDGVPDNVDRCPNQAGSVALGGCPDNDGDGIANLDDKCPNDPGPQVYNGCPDTDGDGLDDSIDRCPRSAGPVSSNGCPEIAVKDKETLNIAMRAVEFDTGRATIKGSSYSVMNQIGDIMNRYPDYNLSINGHTDNTGKESANQKLSEKRAKACYDFLIKKGIDPSRLSSQGFGESRSVADNNTLKGRSLNRRVEFNLVPR